jgi:urea transport system substrate-binding protein
MSEMNRRDIVKTGGSMLILGAAGGLPAIASAQETVKLGLLHSLSGTIAIAEASLVDAEKMAIDEINAAGGVLGRKIEVVVEDGASENSVFAEKARKLLERDKVAAAPRACSTTRPTTKARSRTSRCSTPRRKPPSR